VTEPLVLATRNHGKLVELRPIFAAAGLPVVDLAAAGLPDEEPAEAELEVFATFTENALAKVRYFHGLLGRPCVADDSGLEVRALGGQPGVRSRRWASDHGARGPGEDAANNAFLLRSLGDQRDRAARYVCAAAYRDERREFVTVGIIEGSITAEPRGEHGFGYDPFFFADRLGKTLAEATTAEKQLVSHRGVAFRALVGELRPGN
jgi:XTP/dITP diphosphohydrolase